MNAGDGTHREANAAFGLFARWLDLDACGRSVLLDEAARDDARVHARLLAYIRADSSARDSTFLLDNAMLDAATAQPAAEPDATGYRIGAWILERPLGTGGMGQVWLARRSDGQHEGVAAIKMLRVAIADAHANKRFAQEGRLLAQLAHPHIAMLLDSGFGADGQRYLVIEYVDGERIDTWCDARALDIDARLRLFLQVCAAVTHAHAHLIVHRDIKPSNILVMDDGRAKLLDFGIAKLLEVDATTGAQLTIEAAAALTPGFAAPEQISAGPITVATDVYALGVTLYLLLCGRSPHGAERSSPAQLARAVVEIAPRRLSDVTQDAATAAIVLARSTTVERLRRMLRGDLDVIVARALKKDPRERYASVEAFAADIRRHLEHRPIAARADSATYRLRRFVRRNWLPLAVCGAFLAVVVVSAALIAEQVRRAAREAQATSDVKDFLFGLFTAVDPNEGKSRDISARELLDRGREHVEADSHGNPLLKAELQSVLGRIYFQLGAYPQAADLQQHALLALEADRHSTLRTAQTEIDYANTQREIGDLKSATASLADAALRLRRLDEPHRTESVRLLNTGSKNAIALRDFADARRQADAAIAMLDGVPDSDYLVADSILTRANAEWGLHQLDAAEADYRDALRRMTVLKGAESPVAGLLHGDLAMLMRARSQYARALEEGELARDIDLKSLGADHPRVQSDSAYLGLTQYHLGHYAEARRLMETAADAQRSRSGADSRALAGTLINLGLALIEIPDLAAAERSFDESARIWEKKSGRDFLGTRTALSGLARVHTLQGKLELADTGFVEVLDSDVRHATKDDYNTLYWAGELHRLRGKPAAAVKLDEEALQSSRRDNGELARHTAFAHYYLGLALRDGGDTAGAERELRAALASFAYVPAAEHPWAATTRLALAQLLAAQPGSSDERLRLVSEAIAIRTTFFGREDARTREASAMSAALPGR